MSDQPTFIDDVIAGRASADQIDDYIDTWHESDDERDLHAALGMSWDEYGEWASHPDALTRIIEAHREGTT